MKKRSDHDRLYLSHMLQAAQTAHALASGQSPQTGAARLQLALTLRYLILVIGEAANRLGEVTKMQYAYIPWREMTGMRHRLVHDYSNIDESVMWSTVTQHLPTLINDLETILDEPDDT